MSHINYLYKNFVLTHDNYICNGSPNGSQSIFMISVLKQCIRHHALPDTESYLRVSQHSQHNSLYYIYIPPPPSAHIAASALSKVKVFWSTDDLSFSLDLMMVILIDEGWHNIYLNR